MSPDYKYNNHFLCNPFFLYALVWFAIIPIYKLEWSDLYPELKHNLLSFLCITSIISILLALISHKRKIFCNVPISNNTVSYKKIKIAIIILYIILFLEFVDFGGIPIMMFGNMMDVSRNDFGFPIITVIVNNAFSLLAILLAQVYFSSSFKDARTFIMMLICVLPAILIASRSMLMHLIVGIMLVFLFNKNNIAKSILTLIALGILSIYGFGLFGNIREAKAGDDLILNIGKANTNFLESGVPKVFFWGYIYISSPLANLQNTIDNKIIFDEDRAFERSLKELIPETFTKRIESEDMMRYQINQVLNVGTLYWQMYVASGWYGLIIMFATVMSLIIVGMMVVRENSIWKVPLIVFLCFVVIFGFFSNQLKVLETVPVIYFICFYEFIQRLKNKRNYKIL